MFQSITFYVGEKTLGIYGEEFPLGTLTAEVLKMFLFVCMRVVMGMNAIVIVFQMHGLSSGFSFPNKNAAFSSPRNAALLY